MSFRDALSIVIPAVALAALLAIPGEPHWGRRPWFVKGPPRRGLFAAFFAALLVIAVARTLV
jgi:hypothetical protein